MQLAVQLAMQLVELCLAAEAVELSLAEAALLETEKNALIVAHLSHTPPRRAAPILEWSSLPIEQPGPAGVRHWISSFDERTLIDASSPKRCCHAQLTQSGGS